MAIRIINCENPDCDVKHTKLIVDEDYSDACPQCGAPIRREEDTDSSFEHNYAEWMDYN